MGILAHGPIRRRLAAAFRRVALGNAAPAIFHLKRSDPASVRTVPAYDRRNKSRARGDTDRPQVQFAGSSYSFEGNDLQYKSNLSTRSAQPVAVTFVSCRGSFTRDSRLFWQRRFGFTGCGDVRRSLLFRSDRQIERTVAEHRSRGLRKWVLAWYPG